ncbi:hypothetical protein [Mesorhizobium sp. M0408]|uniref:hypothetical protein n=1 Tax=Mesorhizobium sp. M0408 TaxID=2956942 RepID=UPI0033361778
MADIPRSISWDSIRKMLDQVDRRTVVGRRDYAMLLLMILYGLRAREVAMLMLDKIIILSSSGGWYPTSLQRPKCSAIWPALLAQLDRQIRKSTLAK